MTDPTPEPVEPAPAEAAAEERVAGEPVAPKKPVFTKEPQPDLPLALRKEKAGWNRNRILIWVVVGGFGLYMIITGLVGILTKAR